MDIFDLLTLIGGLSLFLFGMNLMGNALEKRAGRGLKKLLARLTGSPLAGFATGMGVTAIIQSSSATTVMVVGFVNSGLLTLRQAIHVIMGANVGTTITAWILSLAGLEGSSMIVQLVKPSSFTPVLALIGIIFFMGKNDKRKDTGTILLGFATLMFGMETMSDAVSALRDMPGFAELLLVFSHPLLGVLVGAVLTAIIQSSSASVGILQALALTGNLSWGIAIPIIMGQNIGTTVTAMLSAVGANKNAHRTAAVHLLFNLLGTVVGLILFALARDLFAPAILNEAITPAGIAVVHSLFNLMCVAILFPMSGLLEKLACLLVPEKRGSDAASELEERFLATPVVALRQSRHLTETMADTAYGAVSRALAMIESGDAALADDVRQREGLCDHYEDALGTYLLRLSRESLSPEDSAEVGQMLHLIGDFERLSDHAVNLVESVEELLEKGLTMSNAAREELRVLCVASEEIMSISRQAFFKNDVEAARRVEPLEEVVDAMQEQLRSRHILRMQRGQCSSEMGFVLSDILGNLERVSDHCSNIAGCVLELPQDCPELHDYFSNVKSNEEFQRMFAEFAQKYQLPAVG